MGSEMCIRDSLRRNPTRCGPVPGRPWPRRDRRRHIPHGRTRHTRRTRGARHLRSRALRPMGPKGSDRALRILVVQEGSRDVGPQQDRGRGNGRDGPCSRRRVGVQRSRSTTRASPLRRLFRRWDPHRTGRPTDLTPRALCLVPLREQSFPISFGTSNGSVRLAPTRT